MYYPYLRGRQYELLALRELLEKKLISAEVLQPIVEPIKETMIFKKTVNSYYDNEYPLYTVIDPQVGEFVLHAKDHPILDRKDVYNAVLMEETEENLAKLLPILDEGREVLPIYRRSDDLIKSGLIPAQVNLNLVNDGTRYRRFFSQKKQRVGILRDVFTKQRRNVDYAQHTDEFFSDDHLYYLDDGYSAFSDYSIIGGSYINGGFAPVAVAIHIVYFDAENNLRIKHFVSDTNDDIYDPAGKFKEALEKLVAWARDVEDKNDSEALHEFQELLAKARYPGLGVVKKLSLMHHLEIMSKFLKNNGE